MSEVISAKTKTKKQLTNHRRLNRYDVITIKDTNKLIAPAKAGKTKNIFYVTNEELFDIVQDAHIKTGHGEQTRMTNVL